MVIVTSTQDPAVVVCPSEDPGRVEVVLGELLGRVAGRFGRVEPRRTAERMVRGLLAELPRKNCWTLAEHVGDVTPDAMQHLPARAVWDHDGVRDDLRDTVVERLGTDSAVLVLDETGDLKKGTMTVATQRQYTGTAGRIENAQVAVFAVWATPRGAARLRADVLARSLPPTSWQDRAAGDVAKGPRIYRWAYLHLDEPTPHGGQRYLLIRRNTDTGELAFYRCWAPTPTPLAALIKVVWRRWSIEDSFQSGKGLTGLDEHQVRRYPSWARWTVLVMLAHAVLAIAAAEQPDQPEDTDLIPLTRNEIAHLAAIAPLARLYPPGHHHRWSIWRRCHQHRARQCHYQRRWVSDRS